MKSRTVFIAIAVLVVVATITVDYRVFSHSRQFAASSEGRSAAQQVDLCGGTGGNGQVVKVGNNSFVMQRREGGNQTVLLSSKAMIKTTAGPVGITALKPGERVTLVGGPNPDGSFTADYVVVCAAPTAASAQISQAAQANVAAVRTAVTVTKLAFFGLLWFGIAAYLRARRKKSVVYIFFFTIFYIYLCFVLDYTLFQFQSLLLLQHIIPSLMVNGAEPGTAINLVPLVKLTAADIRTSLLNMLMMAPFGFGLPFITKLRMKGVVLAGAIASVLIEALQFLTGLLGKSTFRIADVNDIIFNTLGTAIGYLLFLGFVCLFRQLFSGSGQPSNPIMQHILERPQAGNSK